MAGYWRVPSLILLAGSLGCGPEPVSEMSGATAPIVVVRNATLVDGSGGPARTATDILIDGDRIAAVGPNLTAPPGARTLDATGAFVVPGLIDTHVHLDAPMVFQVSPEERDLIVDHTPRAFLYNGVTTVLNLSSDADWIWKLRDDQRAGRVLAPRIYAMGRSFTPENGWGSRHGGALTSADAVRTRAREYAAQKTDGFKLIVEDGLGGSGTYAVMPEDMRRALAEEAASLDIPLYVHAINLAEFRMALPLAPRAIVHGLEDPIPEGDTLAADLATNGVFVAPTLSLWESFISFDDEPGRWDDPVLAASVPGFLIAHMRDPDYRAEERRRFEQVARMDVYAWVRRAMPIFKENTRALHRAGVKIAVGTDAGGPVGYNFQGFNTPRELELLVEAGLTPMDALVAATRHGAELIGAGGDLGTIEPGKLADLLVLEADPLTDIRNLRRIRTVVLGGSVYERGSLAVRQP